MKDKKHENSLTKCDAFYDLALLVQFKICEKNP